MHGAEAPPSICAELGRFASTQVCVPEKGILQDQGDSYYLSLSYPNSSSKSVLHVFKKNYGSR